MFQPTPPLPLAEKQRRKNIAVPEMPALSWKTTEEVQQSLSALYQYAEARAADSIAWYLRHKGSKSTWSRWLRLAAIVLATLGGLAPIVQSVGWMNGGETEGGAGSAVAGSAAFFIGQLGYVFLALAAACVAVDRFFGFSSGWMRYITTEMALQRALSTFRMDWAMLVAKLGEEPPTPDQVQLMIQQLKEFVVAVDTLVEQETQAWITEFQSNLAEIERTAKAQGEATRPGAIDITVTNGMATDNGFTVVLDGMAIRRVHGTRYQVDYVPPGSHRVVVAGTIANKPVEASELVSVPPGITANVTLALPVEEAQP